MKATPNTSIMQNPAQPHIIRLRKPWHKTVDGYDDSVRIDVPEPASEATLATATYERSFNRPTGLQPESRVLLRIEGWTGDIASLMVNDTQLVVASPPAEIDVTSVLDSHNKVVVEIKASGDTPPGLSGAVSLAIF